MFLNVGHLSKGILKAVPPSILSGVCMHAGAQGKDKTLKDSPLPATHFL